MVLERKSLVILTFLSVILNFVNGGIHVTCTIDEYVKVGLEFDSCQKRALTDMIRTEDQDPCPMLKKITEVCSYTVKHCFTDRGWKRGRKLFFDSLAVQYPKAHFCNLTEAALIQQDGELHSGKSDSDMCTISEEIEAAKATSDCSNKLQAEFVENFTIHVNQDGSESKDRVKPVMTIGPEMFKKAICESVQRIRNDCIEPNMVTCYTGHDLDAHVAYLIENLRLVTVELGLKFQGQTDSPACEAFERYHYFNVSTTESPSTESRNQQLEEEKESSIEMRREILIMTICLIILAIFLTLIGVYFLVKKFRLVPRMEARWANKPYSDINNRGQTASSTETATTNNGDLSSNREPNGNRISSSRSGAVLTIPGLGGPGSEIHMTIPENPFARCGPSYNRQSSGSTRNPFESDA